MIKRRVIRGEYAWEVAVLAGDLERREASVIRFRTIYQHYVARCAENTIRPVTAGVLAQILYREARRWPGVTQLSISPARWRGLDVRS